MASKALIFRARTSGGRCLARPPRPCSFCCRSRRVAGQSPAKVTVHEEKGVYTVMARFIVDHPPSVALDVLTDYEQIPRFMPDRSHQHCPRARGGMGGCRAGGGVGRDDVLEACPARPRDRRAAGSGDFSRPLRTEFLTVRRRVARLAAGWASRDHLRAHSRTVVRGAGVLAEAPPPAELRRDD